MTDNQKQKQIINVLKEIEIDKMDEKMGCLNRKFQSIKKYVHSRLGKKKLKLTTDRIGLLRSLT